MKMWPDFLALAERACPLAAKALGAWRIEPKGISVAIGQGRQQAIARQPPCWRALSHRPPGRTPGGLWPPEGGWDREKTRIQISQFPTSLPGSPSSLRQTHHDPGSVFVCRAHRRRLAAASPAARIRCRPYSAATAPPSPRPGPPASGSLDIDADIQSRGKRLPDAGARRRFVFSVRQAGRQIVRGPVLTGASQAT